jgi:hypothetical protein
MKRISRYLVLSLAGAAMLSLAAGEVAAQVSTPVQGTALVSDAVPPTPDNKATAAADAKVLVSDEAARVGVERTKSSENAAAPAAQITTDPTMRWVIIIGIAVVAALLIVALAD